MKYCSYCAAEVERRIPPGDTLHRFVCPLCQTIHYQNPRIIVGTLPLWEEQILLCRRAIEPRRGTWTLPAGYLENGESLEEGAERETLEEAGARVALMGLCSVYSIPHVGQVYMIFRARLLDLGFAPGEESLDAQLFQPADIPWAELSFSSIQFALERHLADPAGLQMGTHPGAAGRTG